MDQSTEKTCTGCGIVKSLDQFAKKNDRRRPNGSGFASRCKDCEKTRMRAIPKEKKTVYTKSYFDKRQQMTGSRSHNPMYHRAARLMKRGVSKEEAYEIAKRGPQSRQDIEKSWDKLSEKNARQAWDYWYKYKAPEKWMAAYHAAEPWKNPRLSETEKFRIQYRHDAEFCLKQRMRQHMRRRKRHDKIGDIMRDALKRDGNSNKVETLLGYTISDLRKSLEKQFTRGMNWDRFRNGEIHIDHILPVSSFNFQELGDREWKACWALTNLRPMWAKDNIAKRDKILYLL